MPIRFIIGVDEAGRGPIAGPVAVAAFCVPARLFRRFLPGFFPKRAVRDSKQLSPPVREKIFAAMRRARIRMPVSFAVSFCGAAVIDKHGISFAVRRALSRALSKLDVEPDQSLVLLDGALRAPSKFLFQRTIVGGDEKEAIIALASIVAKVSRDRKMRQFAQKYPRYDFEIHKGYGTRGHYDKIKKCGLSPIHRQSFLKPLQGGGF